MSRELPATIRPTCDHLALHARRRPRAVAVLQDGVAIDFETLHRDLGAATRHIAALNLSPGSIVAVGLEAFYPQLLATLALERLGLVTAGFKLDEGESVAGLLARADVTLVLDADFAVRVRALHVLPADWLAATTDDAPTPRLPALPGEAPVQLFRSSGTTGRPKLIEITRGMLHVRVARRIDAFGIGRDTRYLAATHLCVQVSLLGVLATLRVGGTVVSDSVLPVLRVIRMRKPTVMHILPYQVADLLAEASAQGLSPDASRATLKLVVGGGRLSPAVRRAAVAMLCREVMATYGSNETGNICTIDPDGMAHVVAGTELEVVDASGTVVPPGAAGEVRVRGPTVARRYLGDPATTAKVFRDGWCYLGDQALHVAPGRLRLLGRSDDVLNLGGTKHNADDLEAGIMERACAAGFTLRDVALVMVANQAGRQTLIVCAAGPAEMDPMRLGAALTPIVPGQFWIHRVDTIPRTAGGKIQRGALARAISGAARNGVPSAAMA